MEMALVSGPGSVEQPATGQTHEPSARRTALDEKAAKFLVLYLASFVVFTDHNEDPDALLERLKPSLLRTRFHQLQTVIEFQ